MADAILRERIPFEVVINDPKLMGRLWKKLSIPQQVVLKAAYGLPLTTDAEMGAWAILNDNVTYDDLYFPKAIIKTDYEPREYRRVVGLIGRRSGKSYISCFAATYEIIFGGHTSPKYIEPNQEIVVPYVAQDLDTAKNNMRTIVGLCSQVKMLEAQIEKSLPNLIEFKNGIKVVAEPPAIKTGRGVAIPVAILDEVGFWYKTAENANPDFEVVRAIRPSMAQFPHAKMFIISSPYTEEGILWKAKRCGTAGVYAKDQADRDAYANTLVMVASTAAMANPKLVDEGIKDRLEEERGEDPDGFPREYGARFVSAINGFLPQHLVQAAVDSGVKERHRKDVERNLVVPYYVAAMDPATRHDSWSFTVFHRDQYGRIVQDVLKVWKPDRRKGVVLNPAAILAEISDICQEWRVNVVYTDQHHFESLEQIALTLRLAISRVPFTGTSKSSIYGSLLQLIRQGNLKLLDVPEQYQQLVQLQKKLTVGGMQISAPPNRHDDIASAVALACKMVMTSYPKFAEPKKEHTLFDEGMECINRKRNISTTEGVWV